MSDQKGVKTRGMLAQEGDNTTEAAADNTTEAAAEVTGENAGQTKLEHEIDMKGLLEYLQVKFDEQNKKMDEQSRTLKTSIAENANRFQRIEDSLKVQAEKHSQTVQKLKQDMTKQCDDVRIEAAEEVKKSEGKLVELVSQSEERLLEVVDEHKKEVNDCCATVEDKSILRDKQLEVDLASVQREVNSLKQEILKETTEASATVFLSSGMQNPPVQQPKVIGLNPYSTPFTPARSERQFTSHQSQTRTFHGLDFVNFLNLMGRCPWSHTSHSLRILPR